MSYQEPYMSADRKGCVQLARMVFAVLVVLISGPWSPALEGQGTVPSRLLGKILTPTELPLADVEVTILRLSRTTLSDSAGRFHFGTVPAGDYVIRVRRIGFRGQQFSAHLEPGRSKDVQIVMDPGPQILPEIEVKERFLKPIEYAHTHKYDDFFRYRYLGWGFFKTRENFENLNPMRTADILQGIPRVRVRHTAFNDPIVNIEACRRPAVLIDGAIQYGGPPGDLLGRVHPSHVEMVAVFRGPAEMPAEAAMFANNDCAIMIWTR